MKNLKLKENEVLVLRDCRPGMTSQNGFQYPTQGMVIAPDWEPSYKCGHGLHGFLWGEGVSGYFISNNTLGQKFLVLKVSKEDLIHGEGDLIDKCKFRKGRVVLVTEDVYEATDIISRYAPAESRIMYRRQVTELSNRNQVAGDSSTQKAGDMSTQKAGDMSTQKAGDSSTQKAGDMSTQKAGNQSTQTAGWGSTQKAGYMSTQTAGDKSTQTAGNQSTQTAGNESTQTAGWGSTQKAGWESTQKAGDMSTQTAGINAVQICRWYNFQKGMSQVTTRTITEKEAGKPYFFEQGVWTVVQK